MKMEEGHFPVVLVVWIAFVLHVSTPVEGHVTVTTARGTINGFTKTVSFKGQNKSVQQYLGIPYAAPMSSDTRFERSTINRASLENYNATYYRPFCPQNKVQNPPINSATVSEDCLHLNVFVPDKPQGGNDTRYSVMAWLYGGGFSHGGAEYYSGEILSAFRDVIVVTLNYRLGVFGFLSSGDDILPGNLGLWDQHLAIQWIHENIVSFGGDPNYITLFGESAGAASCMFQATYPGNKGLVKRIISESGSSLADWTVNVNPQLNFASVAASLECSSPNNRIIIECLKTKSMDELINTMGAMTRYAPVKDGDFLKEAPSLTLEGELAGSDQVRQQFLQMDFLSGFNRKDGALFFVNAAGQAMDLSVGISEAVFKEHFIPAFLGLGAESPLFKQAVIHQYTNWENRTDMAAIRDKGVDLASDVLFIIPAVRAARAHAGNSSLGATYMYVFSPRISAGWTPTWFDGANHAEEIPFVFGFSHSLKLALGLPLEANISISPEEFNLAGEVMTYWTNFAKTGNPNTGWSEDNLQEWPEYRLDDETYMNLDVPITTTVSRYADSRVSFWMNLVPGIMSCNTECSPCHNIISTGTSSRPFPVKIFLGSAVFVLLALDLNTF